MTDEYTIDRIMADEHHLVAMSRLDGETTSNWFMSVFDLQAFGEASGDDKDAGVGKTASKFFLLERHIDLAIQRLWLSEVFLLDGWLVVPHRDKDTFSWYDKDGQRNATSTDVDLGNVRAIYSSGGSNHLFDLDDDTLLLKRF